MSFLEVSGWLQEGRYQSILVDTAPTGHTLRMLQTPELLRRWLDALDSLLAKHRYMREVFSRAEESDELDRFLQELVGAVQLMENLLRDPVRCRFIPVMLAEPLSVRETISMVQELARLQLPLTDLVVNRLYPENECPTCEEIRHRQLRELAGLVRNSALSRFLLWGLPLYPAEVRGQEALQTFWDGMTALSHEPLMPRAPAPLPPLVEAAGELSSPDTVFLLFGGKGGVGKTTLACATALQAAKEYRQKRVLLFSTDPAHSLADCLDLPVGPEPTVVFPGLTAVEIDAEAEFRTFKQQYAADLEEFLATISSNFDFTFDRQVMEKILDLAPPGLDEIMALAKILDYLTHDCYDLFVLDSAATGHLLRWLELPALIDQWLKAFFEVLLKYRGILRLPRFSRRLVAISQDLKRLSKLLGNSASAHLCVVSILTEMALEETLDLVAVCERIGIDVPTIFLNLATPASGCHFCSAIHRRESLMRQKFQEAFPGKAQIVIYQQGEPRGLPRLEALAQAMYVTAGKEAICYAD
jgi:arsenite-transporting ATPase